MSDINEAKEKLDVLIGKQRAHMYKPIRIAEILFHTRLGDLLTADIGRLETYRNTSKRWRDEVTSFLLNTVCTSSQKFQDDLFSKTAMPPETIAILAEHNIQHEGIVEKYIYQKFKEKQSIILKLVEMLENANYKTFILEHFLENFTLIRGIKRSIDKAYEIVVYALFDVLVRFLEITVTVEADISKIDLLKEFEDFTKLLIGIDSEKMQISFPANLYRAGATNAADRGVDMWANFGPAIQVKHLNLSIDLAEDVIGSIAADEVVIVCLDAERNTIDRICSQLGLKNRIKGIVTEKQLIKWYELALRGNYSDVLGQELLKSLRVEFLNEFPFCNTFDDFYTKRSYAEILESESPFCLEDGKSVDE